VGAAGRAVIEVEPGRGGARIEVDGMITELWAPRLAVSWRRQYGTLVTLGDPESVITGLRRRRVIIDSPRILARDDRLWAGRDET
jgi:NAD+ kinase